MLYRAWFILRAIAHWIEWHEPGSSPVGNTLIMWVERMSDAYCKRAIDEYLAACLAEKGIIL